MDFKYKLDDRRNWERADTGRLKTMVGEALEVIGYLTLDLLTALDNYVSDVLAVLREACEQVPRVRPFSGFAKAGFTKDCKAARQTMRRACKLAQRLRTQENVDEHKRARREFKKIFRRERRRLNHNRWMNATIDDVYRCQKFQRKFDEYEEAYLPNLLGDRRQIITSNPEKARYLLPRMVLEPMSSSSSETPDFDLTPPGEPYEMFSRVNRSEVKRLFGQLKKGKSTMDGDAPNELLKICADELIDPLMRIINAMFALSHRPKSFCKTTSIVIRKPGKQRAVNPDGTLGPNPYSLPKNYRVISLMCRMSMMVDSIMAQRVNTFVSAHGTISKSQMGCAGRSTDTALRYITDIILTAWKQNCCVSYMGLDINGAYPSVDHAKLIRILRYQRFPEWFVELIRSWLSHETTFRIPGHDIENVSVRRGLPQGSPLSSILFLLYSTPLFNFLSKTLDGARSRSGSGMNYDVGYHDDICTLVVSKSFKTNNSLLKRVHDRCNTWANNFDAKFEPSKYKIMHFTRRRGKKLKCTHEVPNIKDIDKSTALVKEVKVLGVVLDQKLTWSAHISAVSGCPSTPNKALTVTGCEQAGTARTRFQGDLQCIWWSRASLCPQGLSQRSKILFELWLFGLVP